MTLGWPHAFIVSWEKPMDGTAQLLESDRRFLVHPLHHPEDHKAPLISSLANALPAPHKFLPRRELAGCLQFSSPARWIQARAPRVAS